MKHYYFLGKLDDQHTKNIVNFLLECKRDDEDAVMLINSGGGNSYGMKVVYETLVDTGVRLTTIGVGIVASAAASIFAMGDERIILPGTKYLIHHGYDYFDKASLTRCDYERNLKFLTMFDKAYVEMFAKTKITEEIFEKKCEDGKDWILTFDELREYKVITKDDCKGWSNIMIEAMKSKNK